MSLSAGCFGPVKGIYPPAAGEPAFELIVVNNHWHTGLVMSREMLSPTLKRLIARESTAAFVEIGWGDDGFYRSDKVTSGLAIQAVFFSKGSVLHVVPIDDDPTRFYDAYQVDLHRLSISRTGLDRLNAYLEKAFARERASDGSERSIYLQPGGMEGSGFYRARGRYAGWHTCNHWTADAVRSTGFPITPIYSFTADNVGWQIDRAACER